MGSERWGFGARQTQSRWSHTRVRARSSRHAFYGVGDIGGVTAQMSLRIDVWTQGTMGELMGGPIFVVWYIIMSKSKAGVIRAATVTRSNPRKLLRTFVSTYELCRAC